MGVGGWGQKAGWWGDLKGQCPFSGPAHRAGEQRSPPSEACPSLLPDRAKAWVGFPPPPQLRWSGQALQPQAGPRIQTRARTHSSCISHTCPGGRVKAGSERWVAGAGKITPTPTCPAARPHLLWPASASPGGPALFALPCPVGMHWRSTECPPLSPPFITSISHCL